jgi:beta-N-acetylglucosaminidase
MRGKIVLIGMLFMGSTILSDGNIAYGADEFNSYNLDSSVIGNFGENSSYYIIYYNGGEHTIVVNEKVKLTLTGWTDESKLSVNGKIEIQKDTTNQIEDITIDANNELNVFSVSETESIQIRLAESESFQIEKVESKELNEQISIEAENGSGTNIDSSSEVISPKEENSSPNPIESVQAENPSVNYTTHVQDYGWLKGVSNGEMSGTEGQAKRMEAIKISLENAPYPGEITYKTHVQDYGWLTNVSNGAVSGTSGERKRLEAVQINLTGEIGQHYDIYYRVHAEEYGWLDWAKNGNSAGTQGLSKRLEAIEIVLVAKGGAAPGSTNNPLIIDPSVTYSTHVQNYGWLAGVSDGQMSGTQGQAKRMEAIKISLKNSPFPGGVSYKTHVQDYGWVNNVSDGAISGTSGERKRLEAIQINLNGEMGQHFDIYYRVHAEEYGWLDWAKNGESAGTQGLSKRLEAIEIVLVSKGGAAPGPTTRPYIKSDLTNYYKISLNDALNMQMKVTPQTDKYRNAPAYVSNQYITVFNGGLITGSSVNLRTTPTTSGTVQVNVGKGTLFKVLDNNVSGENVSGSTKWYKIEYKGKILYVHSSLATANLRLGQSTVDYLNIRAEKSAGSHIYATVMKDTLLTILEEDTSGWYRVSIGDWRNATSSDVLSYLDPTKFIDDDKQKFQFMDLTKTSGVSKEALNQYLLGKGILAGQGQAFIDAGNKYRINEVYLMAHTLLETGHGTSTLAKGITYNGRTVYNMYGVGAYDHCPDECGAKTAYEKGWFTPYDAIVGGAAYIDDGYTNGNNTYKIVQNTIYEMRWNPEVMATKGFAGHQYATDIGWAYKQVNTMYEVYKIQPYTIFLEIPKYKSNN